MTQRANWEAMIERVGGEPIYLPPREITQPPLLVLHNRGIGLAKPLYEKVVPLLNRLGQATILGTLNVNGQSIFEVLEVLVVGFVINGITITVSVFALALVVAGYATDKLTESHHVLVGARPTGNTAYSILAQYFDPQIVI